MLSTVASCTIIGIDGCLVSVETDIRQGLPSFSIVGLPESAVKESRERVSSAISNSGYDFPLKRITVNLAPADIRKSGTAFDLAIAAGILTAMGIIAPEHLDGYVILGELALDGTLRGVRGILSMTIQARNLRMKGVIVPVTNAEEASVVKGVNVYAVEHLRDVISLRCSEGERSKRPVVKQETMQQHTPGKIHDTDMVDIKGQDAAKRALEVACAGGHNVLMIGPPGSGKTMLSRRLPTILPDMTLDEQIETTRIHSVAGMLPRGISLLSARPFRAPHHTISDVGLVGGGSVPRPGEISLAHNGVLFLDELPEFRRSALEVLRQPLEDGCVHIARASFSVVYPARFMLVAAMNPCPCGYLTDLTKTCMCSSADIQRYMTRLSGPLLDRIDIHIEVPSVQVGDLLGLKNGESSLVIGKRIRDARAAQLRRFAGNTKKFCNAHMGASEARMRSNLDGEALNFLKKALVKLGFSARALHRIIKVARTIADLEEENKVRTHHIAEAVQYRTLDRNRRNHPSYLR